MGRPKELIKNSDWDLNFSLIDAYTVKGSINGHEFVYSTCDVVPRFFGYKVSTGEAQLLKKMLDAYLDSDVCREMILRYMGITA